MGQSARSRSINPGGLIVVLGGILVLVGKFPIWGKVSDNSGQHIDVKASSVVLIAGIVIILIAIEILLPFVLPERS